MAFHTDHIGSLHGVPILFKTTDVCEMFPFTPNRLRQWRKRGFIPTNNCPEKMALYTPKDICHMAIFSEMLDNGVSLESAATAAERGAAEVLSHVMEQPNVIVISCKQEDYDEVADLIWNDYTIVEQALEDMLPEERDPFRFMLTSGDDTDDWVFDDDLADLMDRDEWTPVTLIIDLMRLGERLARDHQFVSFFQFEAGSNPDKDGWAHKTIGTQKHLPPPPPANEVN